MKIENKLIFLAEYCGLRRKGGMDWFLICLVAFFFVIIVFDVGMFISARYFHRDVKLFESREKVTGAVILDSDPIIQNKDEKVIITGWQSYNDSKKGFEIKYPENWIKSMVAGEAGSAWEQKIAFRENDLKKTKKEKGFDLFIYNTKKVGADSKYGEIKSKISQNFSFENKSCFSKDSFLKMKNEEYVYEIIPVLPEETIYEDDPQLLVVCGADEIINSILSFKTIKIKRLVVKPKPIITAPMPVVYDKVNGKLVCDKKNDKPRKSKKGKGRHLDMECCLDPDEYPNPHCTY